MNKKTNTVFFMIGATIYNLLVMVVFAIPFVILILAFKERIAGNLPVIIISLVPFLGAPAGSFFIYGLTMRKISEKVDMDKYFEPVFKKKKPDDQQ